MTTEDTLTMLAKFDPLAAQIAEYKAENAIITFNYEDKQGNKLARSHVSKLRKVKTAIAAKHKEIKADALAFGRAADKKKNEYTAEIDEMIDVHAVPIKEIENREFARMAKEAEDLRLEKERKEAERIAELEAREAAIAAKEQEAKEELDRASREVAAMLAAENEKLRAEQAKLVEETQALRAEAEAKGRERQARKEAEEAAEERHREEQEAEQAEKARLAKIEAERVADVKHRDIIERESQGGLCKITQNEELAAKLIVAIKHGQIPNIKILY